MEKNKSTKTFIVILVLLLTIFLIWFFVNNSTQVNNTVDQNNDVVLNEPANDNGELNDERPEDMLDYENDEGLSLDNPQEGETLSSPITIEGEATGPWYFEGSFGVKLINRDNAGIIADSFVTALGDWMTDESVEFSGTIEYEIEEETEALLVFESANPSGLPENQMTYTIPVTLTPSN